MSQQHQEALSRLSTAVQSAAAQIAAYADQARQIAQSDEVGDDDTDALNSLADQLEAASSQLSGHAGEASSVEVTPASSTDTSPASGGQAAASTSTDTGTGTSDDSGVVGQNTGDETGSDNAA